MTKILDVLNRLRTAEQEVTGADILAPVVPGHPVRVRIAGVVCKLKVRGLPAGFTGFAVLRAQGSHVAVFRREAERRERDEYLKLFPRARFILVVRDGGLWTASSAANEQGLFQVRAGTDDLLPMDEVEARFDGQFFWFARRIGGGALGERLRAELAKFESDTETPVKADEFRYRGMTPNQRAAYGLALAVLGEKGDRVATRLLRALAHGGAEFKGYAERGDSYVVYYMVDGKPQTSLVRRDDLTVETAGICLSHKDATFDLTSLVSVLREGDRKRRIVLTPLREADGHPLRAVDDQTYDRDREYDDDDE